jgi:hypothetical protein
MNNPIIISLLINIASNFISNRFEDVWKSLNNYLAICGYYFKLPSKDEITFYELFGNGVSNTITLSNGGANPLIFYQAANLFKPKKRKHLWKDIVDQATNYQKNWDTGKCRMFDLHKGLIVKEEYLKYFDMLWKDISHKEKVKLHKIHLTVTNTGYYESLMKKRKELEMFISTYDKSKFFRNTVKKAKKLLEKINLWEEEHGRDASLAFMTNFVFKSIASKQ